MDPLVLIRAVEALRKSAAGTRVGDCVLEAPRRFRLGLTSSDGAPRTVLISIDPTAPWIGRPWCGRGKRPFIRPDPFIADLVRRTKGATLIDLEHTPGERVVCFDFSTGDRLVVELQPHRAQLFLLDREGVVVLRSSRGRSRMERCAIGTKYVRSEWPASLVNPFGADPYRLMALFALEDPPLVARSLAGISSETVRYIQRSAALAGESTPDHFTLQLDRLSRGLVDPVIEEAEGGLVTLRPWALIDGSTRVRQEVDAAATVALFHGAAEEERAESTRMNALCALLRRQTERLHQIDVRIEADLRAFADANRHRMRGEALLAGLTQAVRSEGGWRVPDPMQPNGAWISIPAERGLSAVATADKCFALHRRSVRGYASAERRREEVGSRRQQLLRLLEIATEGDVEPDILEERMRGEGIPVGLVRTGGRAIPTPMARLEGVRLFQSADAIEVLVGKSGRDNHRLTFRLAAPEDFWLHALGVAGAHVVVRNPDRASSPPKSTLQEAAQAAAFFSDNRTQSWVDVQWTRRKFVRKIRGAPPGTVRVKKASTLRVRPECPRELRSR